MLRASSLGLSLPPPTIFVVQSCRRLYGARRTRWVHAHNTCDGLTTSTPARMTDPLIPSGNIQQYIHEEAEEKSHFANVDALNRRGSAEKYASARNVQSVSSKEGQQPSRHVMTPVTDPDLIRKFTTEEGPLEENGEEEQNPDELNPQTISQPPSFAAGRPWATSPIKTVNAPDVLQKLVKDIQEDIEEAHEKHAMLLASSESTPEVEENVPAPPSRKIPDLILENVDVMGTTQSVDEAWRAYVFLIDTIASNPCVYQRVHHIPFSHLHRFCRLLARNQPKTHRQYLRLLSVMTYIKHCGGEIKMPEYNALIDHAGKGWRKTRLEEVSHAMSVFNDMRVGRLPSSQDFGTSPHEEEGPMMQPDIYTFTSLLSVAARAMDTSALQNISALMKKAGLAPNRITHLALLRYFTLKKNLSGVRMTLQKMRQQDFELGVDGLNACMWAYGQNGRMDVVMMVYRLMRHNVVPEFYTGRGDVHHTMEQLANERIFVEPDIEPNEITFTTVIQAMSYSGQFRAAINVFRDMLSFENREQGAPLYPDESGELKPAPYAPSFAVYRAIFIGFSKHGIPPSRVVDTDEPDWTFENLAQLFERFLTLPKRCELSGAYVFIVMSALARTTEYDVQIMRDAWTALDTHFGINFQKSHSEARLMRLKKKLFPEETSKPG